MAWQNVPAQPRAIRFLRQMVLRQRVSHALLLTGMAGIGKSALAKEFAKLVNCHDPQDGNCCDACNACRKIDGGMHPDVITLAPEGQFFKIEQIRGLQGALRFRPFEGRMRVIIIQDGHLLREQAGNALLKILEEPPRHHVFLLLALEPQMLLPTLVSRCCQVRLQPLPDAWIAGHLTEQYQMAEDQAAQTARQAMGSLVRARQLVESEHLTQRQKVLAMVENLAQAPMIEFFLFTSQWVKESQDLAQDLEILQLWLHEWIIRRLVGEGAQGPDVAPMAAVSNRLDTVPIEHMFTVLQHIDQAVQHLRGNANRQLTLEGVGLIIKDLLYGKGSWNSIPGGWQGLPLQSG